MSKTIPPEANITAATTTLAKIWQITRRDGAVYRFTDHDATISYLGQSYLPAVQYSSSAIKDSSDNSVDTGEMVALLDSANITAEDIEAGVFNNAEVLIWTVNYLDPDNSAIKDKRGYLGNVELRDDTFTVEFRGLQQVLQQPIGRRYSSLCTAVLGDSDCGVPTTPNEWLASTAYIRRPSHDALIGGVIKPTTQSEWHFQCSQSGTSGASEPSWGTITATGQTISDGTVQWTSVQAIDFVSTLAPQSNAFRYWSINITDDGGSAVNLSRINFRVTAGGTMLRDYIGIVVDEALTENDWSFIGAATLQSVLVPDNTVSTAIISSPLNLPSRLVFDFGEDIGVTAYFIQGGSTTGNCPDGWDLEGSPDGVSWTFIESRAGQAAALAGPTQLEYTVAGTASPPKRWWSHVDGLGDFPDGWFDEGTLQFTSGNLAGTSLEIKKQVGDIVHTYDYFILEPDVGSSVILTAGCAKSKSDCTNKFNNIYNIRAFLNIPGTDKATRYPDANG